MMLKGIGFGQSEDTFFLPSSDFGAQISEVHGREEHTIKNAGRGLIAGSLHGDVLGEGFPSKSTLKNRAGPIFASEPPPFLSRSGAQQPCSGLPLALFLENLQRPLGKQRSVLQRTMAEKCCLGLPASCRFSCRFFFGEVPLCSPRSTPSSGWTRNQPPAPRSSLLARSSPRLLGAAAEIAAGGGPGAGDLAGPLDDNQDADEHEPRLKICGAFCQGLL